MSGNQSRVDLCAAIRRDAKAGLSKWALQRKHGVGYRTVAAALASTWPKEPKPPPKRGSRLDPYRAVIDGWLCANLDAPKKQRHTAKRIFDRLLDEHDAVGVVSYGMVRDYVATRRREIRIESGREPVNTFIPQTHLPGREGEVDFGEVIVRLRGELVTCTNETHKRCQTKPTEPAQRINAGKVPSTVDLVQLHRSNNEWVKCSVTMRPFQLKDRPAHAEPTLIQVAPWTINTELPVRGRLLESV